mgnify:CR=1 FL=1
MKKRLNLFEILGIGLILVSLGLILFLRISAASAEASAADTAAKMEALLPPPKAGIPGMYADPAMPVLQLDGTDYVALLKVPGYGVTLPVADEWSNEPIISCPARYYGSVYDNTMLIGGTDQQGQFDFFTRMEPGDSIEIMDMLGSEFSYTVDRIDRAKSVDYEKLSSGGYPLTLFVRSSHAPEFILVRCTFGS